VLFKAQYYSNSGIFRVTLNTQMAFSAIGKGSGLAIGSGCTPINAVGTVVKFCINKNVQLQANCRQNQVLDARSNSLVHEFPRMIITGSRVFHS